MQEVVTLECTEAKKEGKPVSRYLTTRNKKTVTERIEKMKYNPNLRRHTLHKEIKVSAGRRKRTSHRGPIFSVFPKLTPLTASVLFFCGRGFCFAGIRLPG